MKSCSKGNTSRRVTSNIGARDGTTNLGAGATGRPPPCSSHVLHPPFELLPAFLRRPVHDPGHFLEVVEHPTSFRRIRKMLQEPLPYRGGGVHTTQTGVQPTDAFCTGRGWIGQ